jgi:amino acid adenylation domain-containing protein
MPTTLHDVLDTAADRWGDSGAVASAGHRMSYAELRDMSLACAAWLTAHGVGAGDRVLVQAWNDVHLPAFLFGASRIGAAFVPVSAEMLPFHLRDVYLDAEPALVLADAACAPGLAAAGITGVRLLDEAVSELSAPSRAGTGAPPVGPVAATAPALLIYTSGSTATPKAVVAPHEQILFACRAIAGRLGYRADDTVFLRLPMSFDYGLFQLFLCCLTGSTLYVADQRSSVRLFAEVVKSGATVIPVVPSLATMLNQLAARRSAPTRVRLFTNTGAALPAATIASLRQHFPGAAVILMYGITECKRVTVAEPDSDLVDPLSVGRPLPGTEVIVVDEDDRPVPPGVSGQIVVRGPHVMAGYWRAPELTAHRFRPDPVAGGSLLYTGDYGRLNETGELYFEGRRDDIIKRRGVRVSILEIEAAALDVPGVVAAASIPPREPVVELVLVVAGAVDSDAVARELAGRLEHAKLPDRVVVLDDLPLGSSGKVDRKALRVLLATTAGGARQA